MSEDSMRIAIEKPVIKPLHLAALIAIGLANAFTLGGFWVSLNRDVADVRNAQERTQKTLDDIRQQVLQIPPLSFQAARALEASAENKKAIEAANARLDRVVETIGVKLDTAIRQRQ